MKKTSLIIFFIWYLFPSLSSAQQQQQSIDYDLNGLIYQIKYETDFDVHTNVVGFEKISNHNQLKQLASDFCMAKDPEYEKIHKYTTIDEYIAANSYYCTNSNPDECTKQFTLKYEQSKNELCILKLNKDEKALRNYLIESRMVEVQNKSCVGYSVYRALDKLGLKILDPMSIFQQSRLIWAAGNTKNFSTGLSSVEDTFKIPDVSNVAHIEKIVTRKNTNDSNSKNDNTENIETNYLSNSAEIFSNLNSDFKANTDASFIIVLKSDISVLVDQGHLIINPQGERENQVLHVILLNSISDDLISVYDSGMDIKKSISSKYAATPVSKGSDQLISIYGREVLNFSFKDHTANTSPTISPYNIPKQNFIDNLHGYFIIEKK